jgi:hypothetical protein
MRPASEAPQQRRQTQKASRNSQTSLTSLTAPTGSHKKRPSSRSPQLIIPTSTTPGKATASKAPTPKTGAPKATAPKATAPKASINKASPKARKSAATKAALPQRNQLAAVMAPTDATLIIEEPPIAQMPELPETPEMPDTPQAPEPEIPATPATPETPETPETPDVSEVPETPETPEAPELPEIPTTPVAPEEPEEPAQPTEPAEPAGPDSPTALAQAILLPDAEAVETGEVINDAVDGTTVGDSAETVDSAEVADVPAVPVATERRMPTLAVMTHQRRKSASTVRQPDRTSNAAALDAAEIAEEIPEEIPEGIPVLVDAMRATVSTDGALQDTRDAGDATAETASAPGDSAGATGKEQQPSIITRPVSARYSNRRRKMPRPPDLIWENDPHLPDLPWPMRRQSGSRPHPLPPANLLMPVVVFQTCVMAIMGLAGALLGLDNVSGTIGMWTLAGAFIAGLGSAGTYAISEIATLKRWAPYVLLTSQLGMLIWAMLLLGPRTSLLALAPALIEVMLLMGGALLASIFALGTMFIYAFVAGLTVSIGMSPVIALDPTSAVMVDVVCVVVGMLAALWLLLAIQAGRERALAIARARRHEADVLRNLVTQFRQEVQDDTGKLEAALIQALKGHGIGAIPTEGMYRLLSETIMDTASRLEVLQRDREERLRLEGALRVVIRAVERQWLGIKPEWPGHTGTEVDELVALLRTPRLELTYQNETESRSITPRLIPIPTLSVERDTPPPTPVSRPLSNASWMTTRRRSRRPELYPVPSANDERMSPNPNDGD